MPHHRQSLPFVLAPLPHPRNPIHPDPGSLDLCSCLSRVLRGKREVSSVTDELNVVAGATKVLVEAPELLEA